MTASIRGPLNKIQQDFYLSIRYWGRCSWRFRRRSRRGRRRRWRRRRSTFDLLPDAEKAPDRVAWQNKEEIWGRKGALTTNWRQRSREHLVLRLWTPKELILVGQFPTELLLSRTAKSSIEVSPAAGLRIEDTASGLEAASEVGPGARGCAANKHFFYIRQSWIERPIYIY